ncbi:MAG: GNAT family protein [Pirellulales bacterium]
MGDSGTDFSRGRDLRVSAGHRRSGGSSRGSKHRAATDVAVDDQGNILGSYYLKPNQPGLGDHVCNCGYAVAEAGRGQGMAATMCEHSQRAAVAAGFRAMQFNLVVATNGGVVRLWKKLALAIVGTLPGAFGHPRSGDVDAYVMFKRLIAE